MNWLEYHDEPVTLHSGDKSHWLVRGNLIFADLHLRAEVLNFWADYVKHRWLKENWIFYGIPRGGSDWADALGVQMGGVILSDYEPGAILVDDVCTTGKSFDDLDKGTTIAHRLVVVRRGSVSVGVEWMNTALSYVD